MPDSSRRQIGINGSGEEREYLRGKFLNGTRFRLLVQGTIERRELRELIAMLRKKKDNLAEEDGDEYLDGLTGAEDD